VTANPAVSLARAGHFVRWRNDHSAFVRGPHGLEVVSSSVPLLVGAKEKRPLDLDLVAGGGVFAPKRPLVPVSIAQQSAGGVAVGGQGIRLTLLGADVAGKRTSGTDVIFSGVGPDLDAAVAPTLHGAELFATLRSRLSPEVLRYRVAFPAGAQLLSSAAGGAMISRGGEPLAVIPRPTAVDAQGTDVPVEMSVVGDELVLTVARRGREIAYPVLVDPEVVLVSNLGEAEGWAFESTGKGSVTHGDDHGALSLTMALSPWFTEGRLSWTPTDSLNINAVEFVGMHEGAASGWIPRWDREMAAVGTEVSACNWSWGGASSPYGGGWKPMPGYIRLPGGQEHECDNYPIFIDLYTFQSQIGPNELTNEEFEEPELDLAGSLSVGAIVLTGRAGGAEARALEAEEFGETDKATPNNERCLLGDPVDCASGNQVQTQTDLSIGGRGPALALTRTYNSRSAREESSHGPFGFGWSGPYSAHLTTHGRCEFIETICISEVDVYLSNGTSVRFEGKYYAELATEATSYKPCSDAVQATLVYHGATKSFLFTLPNGEKLEFVAGRVVSEVDRNGNTVTMKYNSGGQLESVTDSAGRKLTFAYSSEGEVESATDPMGHTVKYIYEAGNLATVTEPGESAPRWRFAYDASHELTEMTDGRGNTVKTSYTHTGRVKSQTDALGHTRTWEYPELPEEKRETVITEPNGAKTIEKFNTLGEPTSITHAAETGLAATTTDEYNEAGELVARTDPAGQTVKYGYDEIGDRTSEVDALGHETKWTYNAAREVTSVTSPSGETTMIERDTHGNATAVSRPAPGETTQTTKYKYDSDGDVTSVTNPMGHAWTYEYDAYGDRASETDPTGDKRTWTYNEDSQETATVSPRGNVEGANPAWYTTTIERDAQGRPLSVTQAEEQVTGHKGESPGPPASTEPPVISGTAQQSQVLTVVTGGWNGAAPMSFAYQWQSCNTAGTNCTTIAAASGSTYTPGAGQVGKTLRAVVSASNSAGSDSSTSEATAVVVAGPSSSASYSSSFGTRGTGTGQFEHPADIVVEGGHVWVLDQGASRIEECNEKGESCTSIGSEGSGNGQLLHPTAMAVDSKGDLWVLDTGNGRIEEFSETGAFVKTVIPTGSCEIGLGEGIAISPKKDVWISATGAGHIVELNSKGKCVTSFGKQGSEPGDLGAPEGLAIDSAGDVWVADYSNDRVEEFSETGGLIREFGESGGGGGQFRLPYGVAIDTAGDVWVADELGDRVQEFNAQGEYLTQFGSNGTGPGEFNFEYPIGLATDAAIWVTDPSNARVEKWSPVAPANTQPPSIVGTPVVGQTLSADNGVWTGTPSLSYSYQWQSCKSGKCKNVKGATTSTYTLLATEAGQSVQVIVTATNAASAIPVTSAASAAISSPTAPYNKTPPSIVGQPMYGDTLTASTGAWTGTTPLRYTYQWQLCSGSSCKNIPQATNAEYIPGDAEIEGTPEIGNTLRVLVTATNSAGHETSQSPPTAAVTARQRRTTLVYDADGDLQSVTDPDGHKMTYSYNADDEPTKVEEPNGTTTETEYNAAGQVSAQIDGNKHTTTYSYDLLGNLTEETNPLGKKTIREYNKAGAVTLVTTPGNHTTAYGYNADNELTTIGYEGRGPNAEYEYNADGDRTKMTDSTGETFYTYDQLERLTRTREEPGASTVSYEYNLDNQPTAISYPNGKSVTRAYDNDGRLHSVEDWLGHINTFSYDPDSDLTATTFPSGSDDVDEYTYDGFDEITAIAMKKSSETLASLAYTRDSNGQLTSTVSKGLPGSEAISYSYDANDRLSHAEGTSYSYDAAGNPTAIGSSTNVYNQADQLEASSTASYTYNEMAQRTEATPTSGPPTTYGYGPAGDLTSVTRPKEGATPAIEDDYTYNGDGLRTAETISGTTNSLTWDVAEELPLLLSNGTDSFIYGPSGAPVEQINNTTSTVQYLHHDQAGSTRLITGSMGKVEGKCTYSAYGTPDCEGMATTPLGYDAQYTSSDTGLIYMRARTYDPSTAQFLSVDPLVALTRAPYAYANDNPVNESDPLGLFSMEEIVGGVSTVLTVGVCLIPGVDIAACGPAIAANAAVQSALVLASSRSANDKAVLVLANGVLAGGAGVLSGAAELAAEQGAPGGILSYLRAAGALVPSLPNLLEPSPGSGSTQGNGCG
jgi:RHS repeat-associated protein